MGGYYKTQWVPLGYKVLRKRSKYQTQNQKIFRKKIITIRSIMGKQKLPEGTIKTNKNGAKFLKKDGKWIYLKKPREEWNIPIGRPKEKKADTIDYPEIKIPDNMKETQYSGYYITNDGRAYRKPGKYDKTGKYGLPNENGLIYLKPAFRGHPKYTEHQYECINVSVWNKDGNYKQIKRSIHQLVAECFVSNPDNHTEVDHIDRNKRNNHYTNLRWISRYENASDPNEKSYTITDTLTNQIWKGNNLVKWAEENYDLINTRSRSKNRKTKKIASNLAASRLKKTTLWGLIVEY